MSQNETAVDSIVEAELLELHRKYFNVILLRSEDLEEILREISADDISFFGTGKDEHGFSLEHWVNTNIRAIEQIPSGASYSEKQIRCRVNGSLGLVEAELIISIPSEGKPIELLTRASTVYQKQLQKWKAVHVHLSFPSSEQAEGEAWPIEALEAKNRELTKIVAERTADLLKSLEKLKTTQAQLIQKEKMAYLAELTAGIAHEIQNPLNFVKNFSEVNLELLAEVKDELNNGNVSDAIAIHENINHNMQKIAHHSKRADAIVKGMLQHSRADGGKKEFIDINALADEYLRLSYHGLRSKDKSFNAALETDFDACVEPMEVVPQDMSRVLLNLFNNAFYAVKEKSKWPHNNGIEKYKPTVQVTTKRTSGGVEIKIKDNGIGIPESVVDKLFQPFFTTKPTGEGTGLGLSLSYDIIKAHGGELQVNTKEGEGAEFIIQLPF